MTNLLVEIQAAAIDPNRSVADLLRQCQILAFRLKHEPFKAWVSHELNGYPDGVEPPPYRSDIHGTLRAELSGPFGKSARNVPVPMSEFPGDIGERLTRFSFRQGVASLESLVTGAMGGGGSITRPVPVEIASSIEIWQGYETIAMRNELPISAVVGILDQVRNRALEFSLEIESENPDAGTSVSPEPPVSLQRADAIFNTTIYGGQVAVGPGATVNVSPGDLISLLAFLETQGVSKPDRDALEAALEEDGGTLGSRVKEWLGEMAVKAASFGGAVGAVGAGGTIAGAVLKFLGAT